MRLGWCTYFQTCQQSFCIYLAGEDFELVSMLLTFTSTISSIQVQIPIIDDSVGESPEDFVGNLTLITADVDVDINPSQAIIVIQDDDGRFGLRLLHVRMCEEN